MRGTFQTIRRQSGWLFVSCATFAAVFAADSLHELASFAQDKPDRPRWAQKSKTASTDKSQPATQAAEPDDSQEGAQRGRIRVNVNLVNVLVSVLDEHNRPAPDLPRESFQLFEEGVEQMIDVFESETQLPLDLALMIDSSLSAHKEIAFEQDAAGHFIRQVLRPGDRLAVFAVGESVTQLAGFSDNVATLQAAVHRMPADAGTSIYDAILLASRALEHRGEDRRRVIILVTDAGETTSRADFDAARKEAVRSGSLLYTIVIRPIKNESGRNTAGEHALETITDTMGGAMFFPDSASELDGIFDRINHELRTQYRLGYYPEPRGPANTYREIQVKVSGKYQVRHRKSYLTGPQ
jgi:Ca-activated chloride channel homolog